MAKERIEIGELSVDLKTMQGQIKVAEGMVRTLKSNLRDLSSVKINANGEVSGGFDVLNDSMDRSNKKTASGTQLLRDFYREQRIQDRTTREASSAVIGFTVGLSTLISTGEGSNRSVQAINKSLLTGITAMQGAEFASASLSIAGRNLSGSLGTVAHFLGENAGMIGAVVGVGTALIAFFNETDEAAKKAAEGGLADFEKRMKGLVPKDQSAVVAQFQGIKDALAQELNSLPVATIKFPYGKAQRDSYNAQLARQAKLREEIGITDIILQKAIEVQKTEEGRLDTERRANEILNKYGTEVQKIDFQLVELNKKKEQGILLDADGVKIADKIEALEKRKKSLQQSTTESLKEQEEINDKIAKQKKEAGDVNAEIEKSAKTASVNFVKELQLLQLNSEEQLILLRTRSEAEKLEISRTFAMERIKIEEDSQLAILAIEKKAMQDQLLVASTDLERRKLNALIVLNGQTADNVRSTATAKRSGLNSTAAAGRDKILSNAKDFTGDDFGGAVRLARTQQLNGALVTEQQRLVKIERQLLIEKDAARAEQLEKERQTTLRRIGLMQEEVSAREQMTAQLIQSGFDSYDASKTITENMATIARAQIKQALSVAVADALKSVFVSVPFPLNLILAPIAGAAASALFESVVPKFAKGGKLDGPSLRMAGEAGPEFYAPEKDFYDVAREEIIPQILSMAKRDLVRSNTVINNSSVSGGSLSLAGVQGELVMMRKEFGTIVQAIREMPAAEVVFNNPIDFQKALEREFPNAKRKYENKYPDSK